MELVTVFLPTYSRYENGYLERAIESVLSQTWPHIEFMIIDDASVDGSRQLIEQYAARDERIRYIRMEQNRGLPAQLIGLAYLQCRGDFLAFAYDDCVLYPNHLNVLLDKFRTEPDFGMVYGQADIFREDGGRQTIGSPYDADRMAAANNHIPNVSVMIRRDVVEAVGLYDPHVIMKRFYDWDLWRRIAARYPVGFVPQVIAEEWGTVLKDSMGNSHTVFTDLLLKYAGTDRTAQLLPGAYAQYDPFRRDLGLTLSREEREKLDFLFLEHGVKTFNIADMIRFARDNLHVTEADGPNLRWRKIMANNRHIREQSLLLLLESLSDYADRKHALDLNEINELKGLVVSQLQHIDAREAHIRKLESGLE